MQNPEPKRTEVQTFTVPDLELVADELQRPFRATYASLSIAAGVTLFELSRFMGTSPAMLDKTYGHLLPDALERGRTTLDSFLETKPAEAFGH